VSAPHGRGWLHYASSVLLHALVFAIVGPLIGALVFGAAAMAILANDPSSGLLGLLIVVFTAWFTVPLAYVLGLTAAAATGAIMAVATSFLSAGWLYAFAVAMGALMALRFGPAGQIDYPVPYEAALATAGALASAFCTLLTSGFRLRPMMQRDEVRGGV
jgi:hypothetical protein